MQQTHQGSHPERQDLLSPALSQLQSITETDFQKERDLPGSISKRYLEHQQKRESNARSYPRRICIAISEAKGIYIKDVDGNLYFDCLAGAGTLALGHNHPVVLGRKIQPQIQRLLILHNRMMYKHLI